MRVGVAELRTNRPSVRWNDLQSTRHELIQVERARDSLEQQVGQLEDKVGRLEFENNRLAALAEIRNY